MFEIIIAAASGILVGAVAMYLFKPQVVEVVEEVTETFEEVLNRLEGEKEDIEKEIGEVMVALATAAGNFKDNLLVTLEELESDFEQVKDEIADLFTPNEADEGQGYEGDPKADSDYNPCA